MDTTPSNILKRPLEVSPTSPTEPVTPRKRQRRAPNATPQAGTSRTPKTPRKPKTPLEWQDIPKEWTHNRSPFLELPVELLDKITGSGSGLELQDHLALSGTCRTVRYAYTDAVWKGLIYSFIDAGSINHIFSRALEGSQDSEGKDKERDKGQLQFHQEVIGKVNTTLMTKTTALQTFKISDKDLAPLKFQRKPNPYAKRSGAPMRLYLQAQVRSLAIRIHGGSLGHAAHLRKLAQTAEKTRITKEKNGTTPKKKDPAAEIHIYTMMVAELAAGYDYYGDSESDYYDCGGFYPI